MHPPGRPEPRRDDLPKTRAHALAVVLALERGSSLQLFERAALRRPGVADQRNRRHYAAARDPLRTVTVTVRLKIVGPDGYVQASLTEPLAGNLTRTSK